jgi:hypothetical protein
MPARSRLLPLYGLLCASCAWAQSAAPEPESVGDRFARNNAAPGIMLGPWKISPSSRQSVGYDDNIAYAAGDAATASPIAGLRGRLDIANEDGPDSLTLTAEIEQTWYTDASQFDHFDWSAEAAYGAQVSDYVRIRGTLGAASAETADATTDGIVIGGSFDPYVDLARYTRVPAALTLVFDTGRWQAMLAGEIVWSDYDDRLTAGGVLVDQSFRNGANSDIRRRAGWRATPGASLFVEGGANIQRYDDASADSDGWRAVAGAEFAFSRLLTGEVFAGYAAQSFSGGGEVTGLTYGAVLTWFPTELISLTLTARRDFGAERTAQDAGGTITAPVTRDSVRLAAEYEPLRQMLARAEIGWGQDVYDGQDRRDERFFTGLGFDYVFTPRVRATLDWRYEERTSAVAGDATRNLVRLGLTTGY